MTRKYEFEDGAFEVGQIVTHDLYDGCVLKALVASNVDDPYFSYKEEDDCQYATIIAMTDTDRKVIMEIMKTLDEGGVYYETDFDLPTTTD